MFLQIVFSKFSERFPCFCVFQIVFCNFSEKFPCFCVFFIQIVFSDKAQGMKTRQDMARERRSGQSPQTV